MGRVVPPVLALQRVVGEVVQLTLGAVVHRAGRVIPGWNQVLEIRTIRGRIQIIGYVGCTRKRFGPLAVAPLFLIVAITALEILVAFLQAYVFAILTCIYLSEALHLHEHH